MSKWENNDEQEIKVFYFDNLDDMSDEELTETIISIIRDSHESAKHYEESNIGSLLLVSLLLGFNWIYFLIKGSFMAIPFMISAWTYSYLFVTRLRDYINHYYK